MAYDYTRQSTGGGCVMYYNISPLPYSLIAVGETITITGEIRTNSSAYKLIVMSFYNSDDELAGTVVRPFSAAQGETTPFTYEFTLSASARVRMEEMRIEIMLESIAPRTSVWLHAEEPQKFCVLKYRIAPRVTAATIVRVKETDALAWAESDEGIKLMVTDLRAAISGDAVASDLTTARIDCICTNGMGSNVSVQLDAQTLLSGGYAEDSPGLFAAHTFPLAANYDVSVIIGDAYEIATMELNVPRAFFNFHMAGASTGGAAFGMPSASVEGNPLLESAYPIHGYNGIYGADGKRVDVPHGWYPGDEFALDYFMPGLLTGSRQDAWFSINVGMPIFADSAELVGACVIRGIAGYLDNMSYQTGIDLTGTAFDVTVSIANALAGQISVCVTKKSGAFGNSTNNTPIMVNSASNNPMIIKFRGGA